MDFDIQRIGRSYSFTLEGGSYVTYMAEFGQWRLIVTTKDFI